MKDPTRRVAYGGKLFHGKAGHIVHHIGTVMSGHTGSRAGDIVVTSGTTGISTPGQSTSEQSQHLADTYACEHATDPDVKKMCRKKDAGDFAGSFGGRGQNSLKDVDKFDEFMYATLRRNWRLLGEEDKNFSKEGIIKFLEKEWWPQHLKDITKYEWMPRKGVQKDETKQKFLDRREKEVVKELQDRLKKNLLTYPEDSEDKIIKQKAQATRAILEALGFDVEEEEHMERVRVRREGAYGSH